MRSKFSNLAPNFGPEEGPEEDCLHIMVGLETFQDNGFTGSHDEHKMKATQAPMS